MLFILLVQGAAKLPAVKVESPKKSAASAIPAYHVQRYVAIVLVQPASVHSQSLLDSNFTALLPTETYSTNLERSTKSAYTYIVAVNEEAGSIFRISFALSK